MMLIYSPPEEIEKSIKEMKEHAVILEDQIINIIYFMKGGISWESGWTLSFKEREHIVEVLNKRIKEQSASTDGNLINEGDI